MDNDGEITMEEFVEGYMKVHTKPNGGRRWSRKTTIFQGISKKDMEILRRRMDSALGEENTKTSSENEVTE